MTLDELYRVLRSNHVQAQGIVDTLQEPLVVLDKDLLVVNANPAFLRLFRVAREDTFGRSLFDLGDGQWDIPNLRALLAEVVPKAAAVVGFEVKHAFPTIGTRTMLVSARQLAHPDHNSTQMLVVFEDVTERQKQDNAKDILVAETRHRMKNLLAMIRAVATQTKTTNRTAEEYRDAFMGRFEAVIGAQELINTNGSVADLAALLDTTLRPIAGQRAVLAPSPPVSLSQHQIVPVSMIVHELATNALKYGALSSANGSVRVYWKTEQREAQTYLLLQWREEGGPPVTPPDRTGFGTKLINYNCRAEGGDAVFDYTPTGLQAQIMLAIAQ